MLDGKTWTTLCLQVEDQYQSTYQYLQCCHLPPSAITRCSFAHDPWATLHANACHSLVRAFKWRCAIHMLQKHTRFLLFMEEKLLINVRALQCSYRKHSPILVGQKQKYFSCFPAGQERWRAKRHYRAESATLWTSSMVYSLFIVYQN